MTRIRWTEEVLVAWVSVPLRGKGSRKLMFNGTLSHNRSQLVSVPLRGKGSRKFSRLITQLLLVFPKRFRPLAG